MHLTVDHEGFTQAERYAQWRHANPGAVSPAMQRAFDAIERSGRRWNRAILKERARAYLIPSSRWQLNMIASGLEHAEPAEAFRILSHRAGLPSYQHRVAQINIRAARLAFRWQRRQERRA